MINTSRLKEGDIVKVHLGSDESEEETGTAICEFTNGEFRNIEENHHKGEIYGSSVYKLTLLLRKKNQDELTKKTKIIHWRF